MTTTPEFEFIGASRLRLKLKKEESALEKVKKRVIVIDDDKSILRTFTRILQKNGYEIDVAETGKEAIEKTLIHPYDLALIDIRLPDMDGTDLLVKLPQAMHDAIKIMITGFPSLETGVKALDEGADAYLVKPVKPEELLALIEEKFKAKDEKA
ncbi:MAG: response regulator [Candidatus Bathyarchaeota archaeon]|nr:response regulator [Candidatus Bathyarchaeota archaeon]